MNAKLKTVVAITGMMIAAQVVAQVTFYEREEFEGRTFSTGKPIRNFERQGFNDRASSVVVLSDQWEVCEDAQFRGRCIVLRPGRYPSLAAMRLDNRVSSVRTVSRYARIDDSRYAPEPAPVYDNRRRGMERLFEAEVSSVRAVVGPPEKRCWVERERVLVADRGRSNVPGAIAGAVIGGILGHQVGGGRGKDLATVGGAVAGAAVGSNVGRDSGGQHESFRNVERCASEPSKAPPEYWDVTYSFRGQEHQIQMTTNPGATITVNRKGEPRA
jgi:uncharacterized protein YcfJ